MKIRHKSGDLSLYGSIILKWFSKKEVSWVWTGFTWLRMGSSGRNF
jgi:hypothetical protein